jgi:hypothetical protein
MAGTSLRSRPVNAPPPPPGGPGGPALPPAPATPEADTVRRHTIVALAIAVAVLAFVSLGLGIMVVLVGLASAELTADVGRQQATDWDLDAEDPGEPVGILERGPSESVAFEGAAAFALDAEEGQLLSVELVELEGGTDVGIELVEGGETWLLWSALSIDGDGPDTSQAMAWARLPASGRYELYVYPFGGNGALDVALHDVDVTAMVVEVADVYVEEGVPTFGFDGRAGQLALVTMRASRGNGSWLDPLVRLYAPDGTLLGTDDDGGGDLDAQLVLELPVDGRYEVEAATFDDDVPRRGQPYTLTVELLTLG